MITRIVNGAWNGDVIEISGEHGSINVFLNTRDDSHSMRITIEQANELADVLKSFATVLSKPAERAS